MKTILTILSVALLVFTGCDQASKSKIVQTKLEINDGWYYINGQKTFISAIGYEIGARPGQHPYEDEKKPELARIEYDLKVIKDAGFNAIRTWSELTEPEMEVVQRSGLKIIYGIWIKPDGNFSDPEFIKAAGEQVRKAMAFTKKFDCIITYLIMNEPMVAHIHEVGARATVDLWVKLRDIIHQEHPGIPVTISNNSAIGEYINENIFDVYGFNAYDYKSGLIFTQGFGEHFRFLKDLNGQGKPMLITEFGMSVSKQGYGMYGGNTLKQQEMHVVQNYNDVLDGGAAGACPFYYADGWWKAGDPATHSREPEEWFGYWGYSDIKDTIGHPRPIWYAISEYIQGIIASPRNHEIYLNNVPVELFLTDKIWRVKALYDDKIILDSAGSFNGYFTGNLSFGDDKITDREIVFEFYDKSGNLVKYETILMLTSNEKIELPQIDIALKEADLSKSKACKATITIQNNTPFTLSNDVRYIFSHHIGWDSGESSVKTINPADKKAVFEINYQVPENCQVLTISAGTDIRFGKFIKTIHCEKILYRGNWAEQIKVN